MKGRTTSHIMGATVVGGMIGAGVALLLAPRSGSETRQQIQQTGRKAKAKMEELRNSSFRNNRDESPALSAWEEEV